MPGPKRPTGNKCIRPAVNYKSLPEATNFRQTFAAVPFENNDKAVLPAIVKKAWQQPVRKPVPCRLTQPYPQASNSPPKLLLPRQPYWLVRQLPVFRQKVVRYSAVAMNRRGRVARTFPRKPPLRPPPKKHQVACVLQPFQPRSPPLKLRVTRDGTAPVRQPAALLKRLRRQVRVRNVRPPPFLLP